MLERDVLFPLAGLRHRVKLRRNWRWRGCSISSRRHRDALSRYLAGERDYIETTWALQADALMQHPQATLFFANQFRGFALAYTRAAVGHADMEYGTCSAPESHGAVSAASRADRLSC